ncbi:short-chain dehydrogenase/reductase [Streptomyces albiflavescens]|uniref:Short-chain dehydrogenase/reductase n=1 Tax=Streptomyces albiflavescens TaxID=1623582 RepID=A0A917XZZ3_9ACTN|nr:oxidoreductase [Streptomyces albiflavescens]GGN58881.1 short-chain dehydrogenase/reductase [Streptomyces albiflavescens]
MSKTFLITGVSTGLGRAFAREALAAGHQVVGTVRKPDQIPEFEAMAPGHATGMLLDVTEEHAVTAVVDRIEREVGPIDVLISNAGYGVEGTVEESSMDDLRRQFDVNVHGTVAVIKAVLPFMRRRRRGHIVTLSSMAGLTALPGVAFYGASKFAVEGISASLAQEVAPFGIHVTSLALGSFRTDWAGRSMVRVPRTIPDYDTVFDPIRAARKAKDGNQTGDPARAARALMTVLDAEEPPVHLVLGSDALRLIQQGRQRLQNDIDAWAPLTASTDHPADDTITGPRT